MLTYYNADIFTNEMGISIVMPSQAIRLLIWLLWAVVPLAIASLVMQKRQSFR
jgi:hypothetical protein